MIFDQFPAYNDNFEPENGDLTPNLVKSTLQSSKIPELNNLNKNLRVNYAARIYSPDLFKYFFSSNPPPSGSFKCDNCGYNKAIPFEFELTFDEIKGLYVYSNTSFFPIDYLGFDEDKAFRVYHQNYKYHNFHFCMKSSNKFTYHGGEILNCNGDDDIWIFVDNRLVIDLGGLHDSESKSINLDTLGLEVNKSYDFDLFFCERHTQQSRFQISTSIQLY